MRAKEFTMSVEAFGLGAGSAPSLRDNVERLRDRVAGRLQLGLRAGFTRYGLCRNLAAPLELPKAKIPIAVRPLEERDYAALFATGKDQHPGDRKEAAVRPGSIAKGARRGFVAADARTDTACYVQWLFGAQDNDFIRRLKGFPPLRAGQAPDEERLYAAGLSRSRHHVGRDGADRRARERDRRAGGVHLRRRR